MNLFSWQNLNVSVAHTLCNRYLCEERAINHQYDIYVWCRINADSNRKVMLTKPEKGVKFFFYNLGRILWILSIKSDIVSYHNINAPVLEALVSCSYALITVKMELVRMHTKPERLPINALWYPKHIYLKLDKLHR